MWHAWERRGKCTGFWWESPKEKRPLGRPRRRWEDGIKMDLRGIGWGGVEWIHLAQDRDRWRAVVSAVMNLRVLAPRRYYYKLLLLISQINIIITIIKLLNYYSKYDILNNKFPLCIDFLYSDVIY
jgi:hypothetical protein